MSLETFFDMRRSALLTILIIIGGFLAALWTGRTTFERLPDLEDEVTYVFQARLFAGGQPYIEEPDPEIRKAFWQPFIIDCEPPDSIDLSCEGKQFGKYPPGWSLVLALGYMMNTHWVINPFVFMLTIALLYRFGREAFDERVGVAAAILMAISPIGWLQSGSLMSHTFALFCTTLFVYSVFRIEKYHNYNLGWGALGGLAGGWLFATRPLVGVSVIAPVAIYLTIRVLFAAYQYVPVMLARRKQSYVLKIPNLLPFAYLVLLPINVFGIWASNALNTNRITPYWQLGIPLLILTGVLYPAVMIFRQINPHHDDTAILIEQPDKKRRHHLIVLVMGVLFSGVYGTLLLALVLSGDPIALTHSVSVLEGLSVSQQALLPLVIAAVLSVSAWLFSEWIEQRYPQRVVKSGTAKLNPPITTSFTATLAPLALMVVFAVVGTSFHFLFNYATTGKATENLYLLIWEYDKVGFGEDVGTARGGHSWDRAVQNLNWDVQCYARDLFGWRILPDTDPERPEPGNGCTIGTAGLSWVLLPAALLFATRRRWMWLPLIVGCAVIFGSMFYWVNAAIYSARYYYEATSMFALVSAVGLIGLVDMMRFLRIQHVVYVVFVIACATTVMDYAPDRVTKIAGYTPVARTQIEQVDRWRTDPDKDVLIISYGPLNSWRFLGALMGVTSPYRDSEYVLARDPNETRMEELLEMFPDREVVYHTDGLFFPTYVERR